MTLDDLQELIQDDLTTRFHDMNIDDLTIMCDIVINRIREYEKSMTVFEVCGYNTQLGKYTYGRYHTKETTEIMLAEAKRDLPQYVWGYHVRAYTP